MSAAVGILGGTFDPVHYGHLRLAQAVYAQCGLAELRLIPLHTPAHRQAAQASPAQRLAMLQLACEDSRELQVDARELQRGDVSFTVDTLHSLRAELGERPLLLIMGADAFASLHQWYRWRALPDYAHIVVAGRPGVAQDFEDAELSALYRQRVTRLVEDLHEQAAGRIYMLDFEEVDISSTQIREAVASQRPLQALLPDKVISYIHKEGLYHRY